MATYKLPLVDSREITFNTLSAEEADRYYQLLLQTQSNTEIEEYLFNLITDNKYVDSIDTYPPGVILTTVYIAFKQSGVLKNIKEFPSLIESAREQSSSIYMILYAKILKAMNYKLEELRKKSLNELLELFALAENITNEIIDIDKLRASINQSSPSKEKPKSKEKANVTEDQLKALMSTLNMMEETSFDETGKFIGDGSMFSG